MADDAARDNTPDQAPRTATQQLVDLVLDPRDPGYEAAAKRRGGGPSRRPYDRPLAALGCLVIGFLLAMAWVETHRTAPETEKVHDALVDRVRAAQAAGDSLAATEGRLNAELNTVRAHALANSSDLLHRLDEEQLLAGQVAAQGPGVEVSLSEPTQSASPTSVPGHGERTPDTGTHILVDRDVRSVVNELWADGAEAIAVNGIRITPTSAIRFAGDAVLVDFVPINSPYVVDAIGDPNTMVTRFASSDVASRYQTLAAVKGIGFNFTERDSLSLPATAGAQPRYARPLATPTGTGTR
jgi:uncharacterized protein YlxW (UPF0749 family)